MKAIINIGLNVGTQEPAGQLRKTLKLIQPKQFTIQSGTWQGITERTLIAEIGAYVIDNFVDAYLTTIKPESATYYIQYSDNNITNVIVNTVNSSVTIDLIGDSATVFNKNNQILFKNTYGDMNVKIKIDGVELYPMITVDEDRSLFIEFTVILVNSNKLLVIKNIQNPAAF